MKWFHEREQYKGYNIYSMKKYVDKKRIIFTTVVTIIVIITLGLIAYYSIDSIIRLKAKQNFDEQLISEKEVIIEKLKQIEAEKDKLENTKNNISNIYHSETKRAFLTFDDGPSQNTETILQILNQYQVKASFFVLGTQVEKKPELVKKIYEQGNFIGNHGYSHNYSAIYSSPQAVLDEYNHTNTLIQQALGDTNFNSHLFRFPGGLVGGKYADIKSQAKDLLEQNEIFQVDWNALTGDSEKVNPTPEELMTNLQKTTDGKNSVVILMHDAAAKKVTADILPQVIDYLNAQGYEMKTFYDIIEI